MLRFDYSDGSELACGVCHGPCFIHFADGERNDVGECCVPAELLPGLLIEANREQVADLLDAAPDFWECPRCGGNISQCDHDAPRLPLDPTTVPGLAKADAMFDGWVAKGAAA